MIIIQNKITDPYFNLAAEQYLLDNCDGDVFMLWRNEKTVVIGNNQNAYAELDREYAAKHGITVSRRLTGGGAVFHDLGNVNFSFIIPSDGKGIDFKRYTQPIINSLNKMGLTAELSGRNDILIDGKKVSGNAQCVRNGKVLHHGTLLYCADLSKVAGVLRVDPAKLQSKGIKSVKSRVANIIDFMDRKMDVLDFMAAIEADFEGEKREFTETELCEIKKLRDEKFSTWEWIWGRSKEYSLNTKERFSFGTVEAHIDADRGVLKEVKLTGDFFGVGDICELEDLLCGVKYEYEEIFSKLGQIDIQKYIFGASAQEISKLLFKNTLL